MFTFTDDFNTQSFDVPSFRKKFEILNCYLTLIKIIKFIIKFITFKIKTTIIPSLTILECPIDPVASNTWDISLLNELLALKLSNKKWNGHIFRWLGHYVHKKRKYGKFREKTFLSYTHRSANFQKIQWSYLYYIPTILSWESLLPWNLGEDRVNHGIMNAVKLITISLNLTLKIKIST